MGRTSHRCLAWFWKSVELKAAYPSMVMPRRRGRPKKKKTLSKTQIQLRLRAGRGTINLNSKEDLEKTPSSVGNGDLGKEVFNELLDAIGEDNFNSIKKFWGKYPKYKDGVYAASRHFPISEERTWRCFVQKATKQYDELEVYLDAHQVEVLAHENEEMEEEQNHQVHHYHHHQVHQHNQVDEAGPSNTSQDMDDEDDSEDPTYVANSNKESSLDESEVSGWVSMYTPDVYTEEPINVAKQGILDFPIHRHVEEVSLQPTFRIPDLCYVDGTHLYGKYKGVLLLAVTMTTNHEIYPLTYSLIDKEDGDTWSWFMMHLMHYVVPFDKLVCIISDRHGGIDVAFNTIPQLMEQRVTRRYCLRHLRKQSRTKGSSNRRCSAVRPVPPPPFAGGADCRHEPEAAG
ncbi:unnamed protein product [Cuscuta campestris]|uniref:MULE transposase domain-containing protein n=1 Tax=Cuscuta campestris TaxID=132261 RepID=A0A484KMU3_9ASTE|nr:unnamed protein product [Cuscuta campestris]